MMVIYAIVHIDSEMMGINNTVRNPLMDRKNMNNCRSNNITIGVIYTNNLSIFQIR